MPLFISLVIALVSNLLALIASIASRYPLAPKRSLAASRAPVSSPALSRSSMPFKDCLKNSPASIPVFLAAVAISLLPCNIIPWALSISFLSLVTLASADSIADSFALGSARTSNSFCSATAKSSVLDSTLLVAFAITSSILARSPAPPPTFNIDLRIPASTLSALTPAFSKVAASAIPS